MAELVLRRALSVPNLPRVKRPVFSRRAES